MIEYKMMQWKWLIICWQEYVHNDVAHNTNINDFVISHVYNTHQTADEGRYGKGWRLNMVQKLEPVTLSNSPGTKYKYTDGDGTVHYFVESEGKIIDEDGLGYTFSTISEGELNKQLTNKDGTILKFDTWSALRRIIASNGIL